MGNSQFMEFGILSSFLSFLPFLLAAGEPAAMTEELPLVSSVVTGGKGTSLMSLVSPHNLHFLWLKFHTRGADRGAAAGVVGRGGRGGRLLLRLLRGRRGGVMAVRDLGHGFQHCKKAERKSIKNFVCRAENLMTRHARARSSSMARIDSAGLLPKS